MNFEKLSTKADKEELEKRFNRHLEEIKLRMDVLKHIATLDTGMIVVTSAFAQRFIDSGAIKLAISSIISFVASLGFIAISQFIMIIILSGSVDDVDIFFFRKYHFLVYFLNLVALLGFLVGIILTTNAFFR